MSCQYEPFSYMLILSINIIFISWECFLAFDVFAKFSLENLSIQWTELCKATLGRAVNFKIEMPLVQLISQTFLAKWNIFV